MSSQKSRSHCLAWVSHLHDGHDCSRVPVGIRGLEQRAVHVRVKPFPQGRKLLHATLPEGLEQQQKQELAETKYSQVQGSNGFSQETPP